LTPRSSATHLVFVIRSSSSFTGPDLGHAPDPCLAKSGPLERRAWTSHRRACGAMS
jgi:hypothetical protein